MSSPRRVHGSGYGRAALDGQLAKLDVSADVRSAAVGIARRAGELLAAGELHDEAQVCALLREQLLAHGMHRGHLERLLRTEIARGRRNPKGAPSAGRMTRDGVDVVAQVLAWSSAIAARSWTGRREHTALKILTAFERLALRARKLRLNESYREVAEEAGVSVSTLHRHVPLIADWLRVVEKGSRRDGSRTTWQLILRGCTLEQSASGGERMASGLFQSAPLAANQFHGRSTAQRLYEELDPAEAQFRSALAQRLGVDPSTVTRNLRWLRNDGLAWQDADGGWVQVPFHLAHEYDGPDFAAERVTRHRLERELYRRSLEQRQRPAEPRRSRDDAADVA